MINNLNKLKSSFGNKIKTDEPLARYSTMKIGGTADAFFDAYTIDELITIIQSAIKLKVPYRILGGGTNTLISDHGFRGLVIKNSTKFLQIRGIKGSIKAGKSNGYVYIETGSGLMTNSLVRFSIEEGLGGLEMHLGLPGTVGGAIYMNSKWTHPDEYVGDIVYQATILNHEGEIKIVPKSYFHFNYDSSAIQNNGDIVLKVVFALKPVSKEILWQTANSSIQYRRISQPQGVSSLGCTFQNISNADAISLNTPGLTRSAGFLLDAAGLKGMRIGNAQISTDHANFIINLGNARAADVIELIELARERIKSRFGVKLKEEIVRMGEF